MTRKIFPTDRHKKSSNWKYFNGPTQCVRAIYASDGIRGCYRGLSIHIAREFPSGAAYFAVYELTRRRLNPRGSLEPKKERFANFMGGGLAGVLAWTMIMPIDVVKSTFQANRKYTSVFDCVRTIYRTGGRKAFFTGTGMAALRAFPVNAVTFLIYEECLLILNRIHLQRC